MKDQSQKSKPMNSPDTLNATSSPGSAAGPSLLNSPDGPQLDLFGLEAVPANHSAAQAKAKEEAMIATSGPSFVGLSPSSILSESLGSKLRRRLASTGSMEYRQTWKRMATRSGRLYWAHTASGHRTSGNGYTGWPTVSTEDHKTDGPVVMGKIEEAIAKGEPIPTTCQRLRNFAQLAGWTSPRSSDPKSGHNYTENMTGKSLPMDASLCGWATPRAEDSESAGMRHSRGVADTLSAQAGQDLKLSTAATAKPVALNPNHSRWLMGFPAAWGSCGATAMQSSRKRPQSS